MKAILLLSMLFVLLGCQQSESYKDKALCRGQHTDFFDERVAFYKNSNLLYFQSDVLSKAESDTFYKFCYKE